MMTVATLAAMSVLLFWGSIESKPATKIQSATDEKTVDLLMPGVQPQIADTYLCMPTKLDDATVYINEFDPHANMSTAHHMLLYGCEEPGNEDKVWNCGEMASENRKFSKGPVCQTGAQILYAWAMDAPKFRLPSDVAFKVGASTNIKWLVLQVHYKDVTSFTPPNKAKDRSGITLHVSDKPRPKTAGVYLLGTTGELAPHATVYMETACELEEPIKLHPFAYRVHTHKHGEVVSGYRIRDGEWTEIGRMSPQKPQMFYNVSQPGIEVEQGDLLAARCTMRNNDSQTIQVGATQEDEMCNFYVMYWVDGDKLPAEEYCFTAGPPTWSWNLLPQLDKKNIPSDASELPGSSGVREESEETDDEDDEATIEDLYRWLKIQEAVDALLNREIPDEVAEAYDSVRGDFLGDQWGDSPLYDYQRSRGTVYRPDLEDGLPRDVWEAYYPLMEESLDERLQRRLNQYQW